MGANALSLLAGMTNLNGEQKAALWERLAGRIQSLSGMPFNNVRQSIDDNSVIAFIGGNHLLVFEKATGQIYRGKADALPRDWDFMKARGSLRKLGDASFVPQP